MARWRVTAKHYIHARQFGEPTTWVREETNRDTGRAFRRSFDVPLYIDPDDPICINKNLGYCVVATDGSDMPGDIVMLGDPTPDMEPLDDEARKITESFSKKWKDPINSLPIQVGEDFGNQLLAMLTSQFNQVANQPNANTSLKSASSDEVAELRKMVETLQQQLATGNSAKPDDAVVLEEIDPDAATPPPVVARAPQSARRA